MRSRKILQQLEYKRERVDKWYTRILGLRISEFDQYDMCIDTLWLISDISYDILHVTVLLKPTYAFQVFLFKIIQWYETWIEYTVVKIINAIRSHL